MTTKLIVALLLASAGTAQGAVVHVRPDGNDANTGADWTHAKATVTAALQVAAAGDEIWVAEGVYGERIRNRTSGGVSVDVALYGGFAGDETSRDQRDIARHATILDGGGLGSVVTIDHGAGPGMRLDGFRVRNGQASDGGGISVLASAPTIVNNDVLGNVADFGGGIAIWGDNPGPPVAVAQVLYNVVQANFATDGGAGISIVGASPVVRGNVIRLNSTYDRGGGIGVWIAESAPVARPVIDGNRIVENRSNVAAAGEIVGGGGIFATERNVADEPLGGVCAPRIRNNVIAANAAVAMGGGIAIVNAENESAQIVNNTVVANSGSGIAWGNAGPTIVNNLVAYNTWGLDQDIGNPYPAAIRHNDVYGNSVHARAADWHQLDDRTGTDGNISADPKLATYGAGRQHVQPGSACLDAGDDGAIGADWQDVDLQPRKAGAHVDIGADESDGTTWPDAPAVVRVTRSGDDARDGQTWATAKATVQAAADAVSAASGGEVWVAEGTYAEHVTLSAWVGIYGGFAGTEIARAERDPAAHLTVLDGGTVPPVVNCGHGGYRVAILDGFRVTNGGQYRGSSSLPPPGRPAGLGGGVRCDASSPVLAGNTIVYNSLGDPFTVPDAAAQGAGVGLLGSHALLIGNTIAENEVLANDGQGGGVYCEHSLADLFYNTLYRNHAGEGPAISCARSRPMLWNNLVQENLHYYLPPAYFGNAYGSATFRGCYDVELDYNFFVSNMAGVGGAVYLSQPDRATVANNLFRANSAFDRQAGMGGEGGAVFLMTATSPPGDVQIFGNTFVDNTATDTLLGERGGAIAILPYSARVVVANNVMAFNSSGVYRRAGATLVPTLLDNCLWNGTHDYVNLSPGAGDIQADPRFVDRPGGNYRLAVDSPAIDAGNGAYAPFPYDLDGAPRVQDGRGTGTAIVDMGAFEYSPDFDGDGTADWSDPDDDNDGAPDATDCAPHDAGAWSAPADVANVACAGHGSVTVTWTVQDPATVYDVAAGAVSSLRQSGGFGAAECRADDFAAPPWTDAQPGPAAGDARWYAVRAANACGVGTWGRDSAGAERAIAACP